MTTRLPLALEARLHRAIAMLSDTSFDDIDRRAVRGLLRRTLPLVKSDPGPFHRLEELDRAVYELLSTEAPKTWRVNRRSFFRMLRIARREMHARELARRAALIGEPS